jgi:co-chaperonin GroES (HSP10)
MNFRLFGERLLVRKVNSKQGTLFTPQNENEIHKLARVVAIADGKRPGLPDKEIFLKVGDLVFFQTNAYQQQAQMYQVDQKTIYLNLLQSEIIGRVDAAPDDEAPELTLEKFHVVGDWCLVKPYFKSPPGMILIPETIQDTLKINFKLRDKGHLVNLDIQQGDELVMVHGRCNPVRIGGDDLGYIHKNDVHGVVEEKVDEPAEVQPQPA